MPSPFPGMDPYVEASLATTLHHELSSQIARQLAPLLRPKFVARTEATTIRVPLCVPPTIPQLIPHVSVQIHSVENREVVTHIEVLSPTNKYEKGYKDYVEKRRRLLTSQINLVEIDLLREGNRVPLHATPPAARYYVIVSRANRPQIAVYPFKLSDRLPTISVPIVPTEPDAILDLGAAFTTIYEALAFDLTIDYSKPPDVTLDTDEVEWLNEHLRSTGSRPA